MFDNKAFNDGASLMSTQKVALKISFEDVTKRVRDLPETFDALKTQVKAQMCKGKSAMDTSCIQADHYAVTYQDETGDVINVSDDEDLLAAYDVAECNLNR